MKKQFFFAAVALVALASCSSEEIIGDSPTPNPEKASDAIVFNSAANKTTRAGEYVGATAAEMLGGMFVVEGTKGTEQENSPSTTVVFDNYLVGYEANSAGKREDDTNNWEYVGLQNGITTPLRMTAATWTALHSGVKEQSIKYWDYSTTQYDFIAWSTGKLEAVTTTPTSGSSVKVTRINTGTDLSSTAEGKGGFVLTALSANDLLQCYYTDINTVLKANYGQPVTLKFKNMAAKVRVALYETIPGYSVRDVKFYSADANPTAPTDLGTGSSAENAVLFTMGTGVSLPQSGNVLVYYPHIGTTHRDASGGQTKDYNKASVTVTDAGGVTSTTQAFGALTTSFATKEKYEAEGSYIGRTLPDATFAGKVADDYYTAVIPNTNGVPLTLRVDYTLVATDGSGETINVYGAKAVVPATYTVWQPNYAYTYIFKISDNTNGWTSKTTEGSPEGPAGLFPITFDAVVASFTEANAEQTTVTTVATPSITTYQQGHDHANKNEYSKTQKAGADQDHYKDLYVQVMDNSGATPSLVADLNTAGKSLLFKVSKTDASEAEVMDALQNRTNFDPENTSKKAYQFDSPIGRNGITLTANSHIDNTVTSIINGVDDQPITKIAGTAISAGQVAVIDIDHAEVTAGTYAYVYCKEVPSSEEEKIYNVVADASTNYAKYYEVSLTGTETPIASTDATTTAVAGKVYFVKNVDATGAFVSYTFKQTKVGDSVVGLVGADIPATKATSYTSGHFYFDVYYQNNGKYAVKVIKIVA